MYQLRGTQKTLLYISFLCNFLLLSLIAIERLRGFDASRTGRV